MLKMPVLFILNSFVVTFFSPSTSEAQRHTYVHIADKKNFTPEMDSILSIALPLIDSVINTQAFRDGILKARFVNARGVSNTEIYEMYVSGKEVKSNAANDTMDLYLETYPDQNGDNIGTTYGSRRIVSSQAYIRRNGARCYAAHLIHEYTHTIGIGTTGFGHRHRVLSRRQRREKCQSVPYIIGDLARKILGLQTCKCECENYPQT
jgi:hypothetical protein